MPLTLAACATGGRNRLDDGPQINPQYIAMYSAPAGEPFPIPAVDLRRVDPQWWRQQVEYQSNEKPGTIVVDTQGHHLYLIEGGGTAMRYGIGVGRDEALQFKGQASIGRKAEWPTWTPTANMIRREPDRYGPYASGLPGGPANPLGPRALYLYKGGRDTYFRLHGTTEPYTIGTNVSSGCIRLMNQDIIDLYGRVPTGARVVVLS
ncbi:MAG TPA: L,D-transpeptidase [Devosia sp.]|nr:L,D-transpeptidase [Devosia sp.]